MRTDFPRLPSGPRTTAGALLLVTGISLLVAGLLYPGKEAMTATALIVIGAGMLAMGILFPYIRELEIGPGGFKTKIVDAERVQPIIGLEAEELTRFAYLVSGDRKHARELVEEALARGGKKYRNRTIEFDLSAVRTLLASLETAAERRWLYGTAADEASPNLSPADSDDVVKALQGLSFHQRVTFLLHTDWSLRGDQIATILDHSPDLVSRNIQEAREILGPHIKAQLADV